MKHASVLLAMSFVALLSCQQSNEDSSAKTKTKTKTKTKSTMQVIDPLLASPPAKSAAAHAPTPAPTEASATGTSQSFREGMEALCNSVNEVPAEGMSATERQLAVARWIDEHVTNPDARRIFEVIGSAPPKQRRGLMLAAVAKAGFTGCAIADAH